MPSASNAFIENICDVVPVGIVPTLNEVPFIFPREVPVDHDPDLISYCSISKSAKLGAVGVGAVQFKTIPI